MTAHASPASTAYADQQPRSPWLAQLAADGPPRPLDGNVTTDVAIVGAGIAGVATAFFILRHTDHGVLLIERGRVARGATGRNAGQMTTYFERPLSAIADEFGVQPAVAAQRDFDAAHDLFDLLSPRPAPEYQFHDPVYGPDAPFPGELLTEMDDGVRPFAQPTRAPGLPYDFQWHGLMGYNDSGIRVVGAHREHPALFYNLGCNGVGFLPSIFGGHRVSRLIAGDTLAPSIFDPR